MAQLITCYKGDEEINSWSNRYAKNQPDLFIGKFDNVTAYNSEWKCVGLVKFYDIGSNRPKGDVTIFTVTSDPQTRKLMDALVQSYPDIQYHIKKTIHVRDLYEPIISRSEGFDPTTNIDLQRFYGFTKSQFVITLDFRLPAAGIRHNIAFNSGMTLAKFSLSGLRDKLSKWLTSTSTMENYMYQEFGKIQNLIEFLDHISRMYDINIPLTFNTALFSSFRAFTRLINNDQFEQFMESHRTFEEEMELYEYVKSLKREVIYNYKGIRLLPSEKPVTYLLGHRVELDSITMFRVMTSCLKILDQYEQFKSDLEKTRLRFS